jgi:hypothetical protein
MISCGSSPTSVTITAKCLVSADRCGGRSYVGEVQVRQPASYKSLPDILEVFITVN